MQTSSFSRVHPTALPPSPLSAGVALPVDFQERASEAANLLKALANPDRLLLLCQLVGGERTVTELGVLAHIEQPSLSQQLGVLRGERLVATRREGKNVFYRVASPAALTVLETLYGLFCQEQAPAGDSKRPTTTGRNTRRRKETA
jgi:ArsR family transcriptional regulator